jgi:membrane-associated phospholipid phosphatase
VPDDFDRAPGLDSRRAADAGREPGDRVASRRGPLPGDELLLHAWSSPNQAFALINVLASVQVWSALVLLTGACLWVAGRRYAATLLVLADFSGEVVAFLVKALVLRARPSDAPLADALATTSFPSGHVMRVAISLGIAVALCAWQHARWRWPCTALAIGVVSVVGIARIASGEHWPSDVVAGAFLAAACVEIVLAAASWFGVHQALRPSPARDDDE